RKEFAAAHITPSDNQRRYYTKKYKDLSTGTDNIIVFRNAEMYLIRAEANYMLDSIANLNAILDDINAIRNRANLPNIESISVGNSLIGLIDKEKQIEFAFEGKRWFDLIRTGKALGAVPTIDQAYQFLFPIPQSEIIANPNIDIEDQNEGY
ncbi:MAG: RagB/SusD family nutrient uptake outer membrane protein, partial [Bacteroidales bacterium]